MFKVVLTAIATLFSMSALAGEAPIYGTVESKCVIITDTTGVYGNPTPGKLSTNTADGGVEPVVRYDVISADFYKARITYPNDFSSAPALSDVVNWTGSVTVKEVSDAAMAAYDQNKIEYNNTTEVDLTVAGSVWFKVSSVAEYGFNKSFPAGTYNAVVTAECVAL